MEPSTRPADAAVDAACPADPLHSHAQTPRRTARLLGLVADVGLPLGGYYLLHLIGLSDWIALFAGTAAAGLRVAVVALVTRRVTSFAALTLAVFGVGLALAFVGGDARFLLWKDSAATATVGIVFLASLAAGRPLTLSAAQTWRPATAATLTRLYQRDPAARRVFRGSAFGWGVGLLTDSALRAAVVYLLPVDVAVGLTAVLPIVTMVGLGVWNIAYVTRAVRQAPQLAPLVVGRPRHVRTAPATPTS
ncbi:MAG TPA: VC0807 family protein [Actinocatenispora sp.]